MTLKQEKFRMPRFVPELLSVLLIFVPLVTAYSCGGGDSGRESNKKGGNDNPWLGQKPPGADPVVFAAGVVSTEKIELNAAFTPDGKEIYFSRRGGDKKFRIMIVRQNDDGSWNAPGVAPFSGTCSEADPFITRDGRMMFFISRRPGEGLGRPHDIWMMDRMDGGWSEPRNPGYPLNTPTDEIFPSMSGDGSIYYAAEYYGGCGGRDVYKSTCQNGRFGGAELVGPPVSSEFDEGDPLIAHDGSWLIFVSSGRPDGFGSGDLYVVFRNENGSWSEARNLGEKINSKGYDYGPAISPDGRYFFFTRNNDIYWVDSKNLFDLKGGTL